MRTYRTSWLALLLMFSAAPAAPAQPRPDEQPYGGGQTPYPDCTGFSGLIKSSAGVGKSETHGGCLTVSDGSVRLAPSPFDFPISDLVSVEKKKFELWKGLQFKLKNGKKIEFYPFYDKKTSGPDQAAAEVEKAIRNMASQQGVVLK